MFKHCTQADCPTKYCPFPDHKFNSPFWRKKPDISEAGFEPAIALHEANILPLSHMGRIGVVIDADVDAQVMPARWTHGGAFEDGLPTMRTFAGRPGATRAHAAHEVRLLSKPSPLLRAAAITSFTVL